MKPLFAAWTSALASMIPAISAGAGSEAAMALPEGFNGVVLVAQDRASPAVVQATGWADQEAGRRFDARTRTQIGSASKLLTAIVVLRLAERGAVDLDAPIGAGCRSWRPGRGSG